MGSKICISSILPKIAMRRFVSCIFLALILAKIFVHCVHSLIWMFILEMGRYMTYFYLCFAVKLIGLWSP